MDSKRPMPREGVVGPREQPPGEISSSGSRPDADMIAGEIDAPVGAVNGEFPAERAPVNRQGTSDSGKHAFLVGFGILLSRLVGLVRLRVFAFYFGNSAAKGAFDAAFRIPNFLQNVFGEGALSASFIPVYAGLLAAENEDEADHVASAVLSMLALITSIIVLAGVFATPYLIDLIAPGYTGETRALTIHLVKILFPGAGLLVLSAWCLGVLNSHRRFFLSYTAPVIWNITIITSLLWFGRRLGQFPLAEVAAWASVVGSSLQFGVQIPTVLLLVNRLRPALDVASANVRKVIVNFIPVFISRGVVQISAYVDSMLASLISPGAVSALNYTQSIYTLPVSLFGMSVSAAELPAMSSARGTTDEISEQLRMRLDAGLRQIAVLIVPSSMAFLALGDVIAAVLFQTGEFRRADSLYIWSILAGSTIGLLASTMGRLYSSTYYALHDTRTPLGFAVVRVILTTALGYICAIPLPVALGIDRQWGVAGLTASAGIAGWVEFTLLRRSLNLKIGRTGLPLAYAAKLWTAAVAAACVGWTIKLAIGMHHPAIVAAFVLGSYGITYFAITSAFAIPEARIIIARVFKVFGVQ